MRFSVLSSGSKANCLYLSDGETSILVDCGLSCRKVVERLGSIGVSPEEITAVVVTHEHSDHIAGLPVFCRKYKPRVVLNRETFRGGEDTLSTIGISDLNFCDSGQSFNIGNISLDPFSILHDARDPVAYRIQAGDKALAVVTDLGAVTTLVRSHLDGLDALVLECNHDLEMLWDSPYPWEVKQRIRSKFGHLSNEQAGELLSELASGSNASRLRYVVAGHISEKSNTPDCALHALRSAWSDCTTGPEFIAAGVEKPTSLISL